MSRQQRRALDQLNRKRRERLEKMPENKKTEIQQKYFGLCAQAGELQYKIQQFNNELDNLNMEIQRLNRDFTEILEEERKKDVKAPVQAIPETPSQPIPTEPWTPTAPSEPGRDESVVQPVSSGQ